VGGVATKGGAQFLDGDLHIPLVYPAHDILARLPRGLATYTIRTLKGST
jgi:hypothetical protein